MKKLLILAVVVALFVPAITYGGPTYGDVTNPPDGIFAEVFGSGGAGSAGGWLDAENGYWAIHHAYSEGVSGSEVIGGVLYYKTVYSSGSGSWLRFFDFATSTEYNLDNFELTVISDGVSKFDFSGKAYDGGGNLVLTFWGPGEIKANWADYYDPPSAFEAISDPSNYNQGGVLDLNTTVVPVPGAVILGSIGAGLVGWFRRRRSL